MSYQDDVKENKFNQMEEISVASAREKNLIDDETMEDDNIEDAVITTRGVDFSVRELVNLLEDEELIKPEFQRGLVWDSKRKGRFIESILLGFPIPGMFFSETEENLLIIIDGQQRLSTLQDYMQNLFPIVNKPYILERYRNKRFSELDKSDQRKLRTSNIRASVFKATNSEGNYNASILYNLFERINTGSIQLNPQEIRNALYHSDFSMLLTELAENTSFKILYKGEIENPDQINPDVRVHDQEIILRFMAIKNLMNNPEGINDNISYKKELNDFMCSQKSNSIEINQELREDFILKVNWLKDHFDYPHLLCKRPTAEELDALMKTTDPSLLISSELLSKLQKKRFNVALFEAILLSLDNLDELPQKNYHYVDFVKVFNDQRVVDAITKHTNKKSNLLYRTSKVKDFFHE